MLVCWLGVSKPACQVTVCRDDPRHITAWPELPNIYPPWQTGSAVGAGGFIDPVFNPSKPGAGQRVVDRWLKIYIHSDALFGFAGDIGAPTAHAQSHWQWFATM
jgi:hypothetical protein